MSKQNDGGPAFPRPPVEVQREGKSFTEYVSGQEGMTLRMWFAGQALAGMYANPDQPWKVHESMSDEAFKAADAMIERRKL